MQVRTICCCAEPLI